MQNLRRGILTIEEINTFIRTFISITFRFNKKLESCYKNSVQMPLIYSCNYATREPYQLTQVIIFVYLCVIPRDYVNE